MDPLAPSSRTHPPSPVDSCGGFAADDQDDTFVGDACFHVGSIAVVFQGGKDRRIFTAELVWMIHFCPPTPISAGLWRWQGFSWRWLPKGSLFFLFHFYVNVFSITGKWENILSTRFQGFIPACAG